MKPEQIAQRLTKQLEALTWSPPVNVIYNPLRYASRPFNAYLKRYGHGEREVLLIGMNPGPWGMVQTGVPFGEISFVKDWLGIEAPVGQPEHPHPKRPVQGFDCKRSEVSGKRLWGWARERFTTPQDFFDRFFVLNYCPLCFFDAEGKNLTPDKLRKEDRHQLTRHCDIALQACIEYYKPKHILGFGAYAEARIKEAVHSLKNPPHCGRIPHPSPASPLANRGWAQAAENALSEIGIEL